jgi:hypothetical protein
MKRPAMEVLPTMARIAGNHQTLGKYWSYLGISTASN